MHLLTWLRIFWFLSIAASAISLLLFHSSDIHGPDQVAREVSGFVAPLVIALLLSVASITVHKDRPHPGAKQPICTPIATLVIAAAEVLVYCTVIVR